MYLVEALKYDVPAFHEDRLTQILAATLNESTEFQRIFLKFLKVPYKSDLKARTQVANDRAPSRPDLIIYDRDRPYILIESKVDARSDKDQQNRHARTDSKYFFLIVRDPVQQSHIGRRFKKVTWGDFFSFVLKQTGSVRDPVDLFLIEKFIHFGKECDMLLPDRILKSDFESASAFLTELRFKESPAHAFDQRNPFQALDAISLFLERTIIRVKDDVFLGNKLRSFTRRLGLSHLFYRDTRREIAKEQSVDRRRKLRLMSELITIDKEIRLKKPIGGFHYLFVRASFVPYYKGSEVFDLNFGRIKKLDPKSISYRCEMSCGLSDASRTATELVTFDDCDDLEFSDFYRAALSSWKRKLSKSLA